MIFKHIIMIIALLLLSGCANEQTKSQPDIPTAKAPVVRESTPKISGKVVGTTFHNQRTKSQFKANEVLQQEGIYKGRNGDEHHDEDVDHLILPFILEDSCQHTQNNT